MVFYEWLFPLQSYNFFISSFLWKNPSRNDQKSKGCYTYPLHFSSLHLPWRSNLHNTALGTSLWATLDDDRLLLALVRKYGLNLEKKNKKSTKFNRKKGNFYLRLKHTWLIVNKYNSLQFKRYTLSVNLYKKYNWVYSLYYSTRLAWSLDFFSIKIRN